MTDDASFPPVPAERSISPAPEDFQAPTPRAAWFWPVFWFAAALGCGLLVHAAGWSPFNHAGH